MLHPLSSSRRRLLQASLASLGAAAMGPPALALASTMRSSWSGSEGVSPVAVARAELARVGDGVAHRDVVGVADFSRASAQPRLHLVDLYAGAVTTLLVAHGRGSDPDHTGWLSTFSNAPGSDATSRGAYLTGEFYEGAHGRSMRLVGLDSTNSNALGRGIVVHAAWYVGEDMIRTHGMLGRSEGCFAVSQDDLAEVLARLGPGRLLVATKA